MTDESTGPWANEVRLTGRVSGQPQERVLPSGDRVWTLRLVVPRGPGARRGRASVDTLDCAAWAARPQRSVRGWGDGDVVSVAGQVRRRFFAGAGGARSRVEIEISAARVIRRADSA